MKNLSLCLDDRNYVCMSTVIDTLHTSDQGWRDSSDIWCMKHWCDHRCQYSSVIIGNINFGCRNCTFLRIHTSNEHHLITTDIKSHKKLQDKLSIIRNQQFSVPKMWQWQWQISGYSINYRSAIIDGSPGLILQPYFWFVFKRVACHHTPFVKMT